MVLLRSLLFIGLAGFTVAIGAILVLLTFWSPRAPWAITVGWCRLGVWLGEVICGLETSVEGLENLPDEPSVIMIKHTSTLETYWQVTVFPKTTWVIKHEVMFVPVLGWAMKLALDPIFINRSAGRDHWPGVGACLLAGGGMRMGQVIGSTDRLGGEPKDRPVHFREVFATLYHNLGIDARNTTLEDLRGRPHYLVDGRDPIEELI